MDKGRGPKLSMIGSPQTHTSIESIIDQLKNISQIEHTRHRSPVNFFVNVLAGLIAKCHQPKKPAFKFAQADGALALLHY